MEMPNLSSEEKKFQIRRINSMMPDKQEPGQLVTEMENGDEKSNMNPGGGLKRKKSIKEI